MKFLGCPSLLCCLPGKQAQQLSPALPARRICSFHPRLAEESCHCCCWRQVEPAGLCGDALSMEIISEMDTVPLLQPCPQAPELNG